MLTKIITTDNEFYALKSEWERLQEQDPDITFYSTFEYNKTWWDVYKKDKCKSLFIICVYYNNKIAGIAPFIIKKVPKTVFSYNTLKFMGSGDYLNFLIERKDNKEFTIIKNIIDVVNNNNNKFDRIQLTSIKGNSILSTYILRHKKLNNNFKVLVECPVINKNNYINYENYKKSCVCPNVNAYKNRLESKFKYKFTAIINENNQLLDKLSEIHIKEQDFVNEEKNIKTRRSLFRNDREFDFVSRVYNKNNNIVTFILESEDKDIITYIICYLYKRILYSWNTAFNVKYKKYCVGKVINYEINKFLFENNIADVYDFGAGRYPWKFEWTKDFNTVYQLSMWNIKTFKGAILKSLYKIKELLVIISCL